MERVVLRQLVTIACAGSRQEAHVAAGFLESHGIPCVVSSDDAGGVEPQLGFTRGFGLKVGSEDADDARELLAEIEAEDAQRD